MNKLFDKLKEGGLKLTPQRLAIADYLKGNTSHPTAAKIYEDLKPQYPSMSMATIYNTLSTMAEMELIQELRLHKEQIHYDPDMSHHLHFFCRHCHSIIDVPHKEGIPDFKEFEKKTTNRIDHVSVALIGVCKKCLQKKQ